mgnify:FL=1
MKMADKSKFALWMYPETFERVEKLYREDGCKSRSEFIEKAINFYCGYLTAENYREYFPSVIVSTVKGSLDSFENRMASLLFKTAVELSMMLHMTAANYDIDEEMLSRLRGMCVKEVKRLHGTVSLDDAVKFQKG